MPVCPKCGLRERHKTPSQTLSYCKPCYLEWQKLRRPPKGKPEYREVDYAVKRSANIAVGNAITRGVLIKPDCCSKCGSTEKIQGHHQNYSKPLEVIWLCYQCHKEIHNGESKSTS